MWKFEEWVMALIKRNKSKSKSMKSNKTDNHIVEGCKRLISLAREMGIDAKEAEELLLESREAFKMGSNKIGRALARKAKRRVRKKINSRDKPRLRVLLSNKGLSRYNRMITLAEEKFDLSLDESDGLRLLKKAEEKKSEGYYAASEAYMVEGKEILKDEIETLKFRKSIERLLKSQKELLSYLETDECENEIESYFEDLKDAKKAAEKGDYQGSLSLSSNLLKRMKALLNTLEIEEILSNFEDSNNLRVKKEDPALTDKIEELENDYRSIKRKIEDLTSNEKSTKIDQKELKDLVTDRYVELEIEKISGKLDQFSQKHSLDLNEILEKLEEIKKGSDVKEKSTILKNISRLEAFMSENVHKKRSLDKAHLHGKINKILFESEEKSLDQERILKIFNTSPRIDTQGLDFSSKTMFFISPSLKKEECPWLQDDQSVLNWKEYADEDLRILLHGIKIYEKSIGLEKLILFDGVPLDNSNDIVLISGSRGVDPSEMLSDKTKKRSFIDSSKEMRSPLYQKLNEQVDSTIVDVALNTKRKDSKLYKQLFKDLTTS